MQQNPLTTEDLERVQFLKTKAYIVNYMEFLICVAR